MDDYSLSDEVGLEFSKKNIFKDKRFQSFSSVVITPSLA